MCQTALNVISVDALGAVPDLRKGLSSKNPEVRKACALALRQLGCAAKEATPDLIKLMATYENSARWAGAALSRLGPVGAEDAKQLLELARRPGPDDARYGRIKALLAVGKDALPTVDEIERGLGPQDNFVRGAVQDVRREVDREKEIDRLIVAASKESQPTVPATAALALGASPEQKRTLAEHLGKRLEGGTAESQLEVLRALGWIGADAAVALPAVEPLLTSPNESLRRFAKDTVRRLRQ